jgi:hypothetical protein
VPPELNRGGQFAAFIEHPTDGLGRRLIHAEHGASMDGGTATDKPAPNYVGRRVGPRQGSEILPGPLDHLERITGMEIPGASAEMVSTKWYQLQTRTTHGLSRSPAFSA